MSIYKFNQRWSEVIGPQRNVFAFSLKEVSQYRDLWMMFVWRDFVSVYKQTILGPLWFLLQPVLTSLIFVGVFGNFAGLSTDGLPKFLFYLAGTTIWNYFSECFLRTSQVFSSNATLYSKVYFPRLIIPFSIITSNLIKFFIQFFLFLTVLGFYYFFEPERTYYPNLYALLTPFFILIMAGFALGGGLIFSAMTNKYRDLVQLIGFGVQLLMYITPIIYPVSSLSPQSRKIALINPLAHIVEGFRYAWTGAGIFSWDGMGYCFLVMSAVLILGIVFFNRVESTFIDNV